jgi:elongation factor P--(R)-beta-lysine ligase
MPPSAGIALGLERLFMALRNIQNIEEIRLFPIRS